VVHNEGQLGLGLDPITQRAGLLTEVVEVARKYAYRDYRMSIPCVSAWTKEIGKLVERDPEHRGLKSA
jgi:UDP-sulfoquinovose synthase